MRQAAGHRNDALALHLLEDILQRRWEAVPREAAEVVREVDRLGER